MLRDRRWIASVVALMLVAACGGGGGGVNSTPAPPVAAPSPTPSASPSPAPSPSPSPTPEPVPSPTPTATPSPAPSPSPTATPSPAPSPSPSPTPAATNRSLAELTVSETFAANAAVANASYPGEGTSPQAVGRASLSVRYDADARSYTVTEGTRAQLFRPADIVTGADPRGAVYRRSEGAITDTLLLTQPAAGPVAGMVSRGNWTYHHVGAGLWRQTETANGIENNRITAFTYGVRTPDAEIPRAGAGSFAVVMTGRYGGRDGVIGFDGSGLLLADFATARFTTEGRFAARIPAYDGSYSIVSPGSFTGEGSIALGANALLGTLTIRGPANWSAALDGRFYGPGGVELGASFYGFGDQSRQMAGVLLGRPGIVAPVLETFDRPLSPISVQQIGARFDYVANANGSLRDPSLTGQYQTDLRWNADTGTYITNGITYGPDQRIAAESDGRFTTYRIAIKLTNAPDTIRTIRAYNPGGANGELVLSYLSFAGETIVRPDQTRVDQWFTYGLETGFGNVPRSGTGGYSGVLYGSAVGSGDGAARYALTGQASFGVDFGAGTFNGQMIPTATNTRTGVASDLGIYTIAQTQFPNTATMSNALAGNIAGPAGTNGSFNGRFYGPAGEEIGGVFSFITPGAGTVLTGTGALVARRR